jgi:hypothetical protein
MTKYTATAFGLRTKPIVATGDSPYDTLKELEHIATKSQYKVKSILLKSLSDDGMVTQHGLRNFDEYPYITKCTST